MRNGTVGEGKPGFDLWSVGREQQKKELAQTTAERTIIVLGDHNSGTSQSHSGKSSFVKTLKAENETEVKPTGALEYTFIRRSAAKKEVVHCYEVAGKNLRGIIQSLLNRDNYAGLLFVVVVDMSQPAEAIESLGEWLETIRDQGNRFLQKLEPEAQRRHLDSVTSRFASHEDGERIQPLPLPTIIIGNKFDLYERFDTEVRKWIARTLRYLALVYGCSLVFSSVKSPQVSAQVRSIFNSLFFGENPANLNLSQKDHMKPIFIMSGLDTINAMNLPHPGSLSMEVALKKHIAGLVPAKQERKNEEFDFSRYKETRIDSLVAEKQKELEKISREFRNISSERRLDSPGKSRVP